jgi:hypothetical protein
MRTEPLLVKALRIARARFAGHPDVLAIGIGRKFWQRRNQYARRFRRFSGFCLHIYVRSKKPTSRLALGRRLPRNFSFTLGRHRPRVSLAVDVIETGRLSKTAARGWPTARSIQVGRIFGFAQGDLQAGASAQLQSAETELGTPAAMLKFRNGQVFAVSAGHVFADTDHHVFNLPQAPCRITVTGNTAQALPANSLMPASLGTVEGLHDSALMLVPPILVPAEPNWPADVMVGSTRLSFDGQLATGQDLQAAMASDALNGIVWVERSGASQALPIDLLTWTDHFSNPDDGIDYGYLWPYRFLGERTIAGDSGSGVFVVSVDGTALRLVGVHVMASTQKGIGYAVEAESFFRMALGALPPNGYDFFPRRA